LSVGKVLNDEPLSSLYNGENLSQLLFLKLVAVDSKGPRLGDYLRDEHSVCLCADSLSSAKGS